MLGDSLANQYPAMYARDIETDLGVHVVVHMENVGGESAGQMASMLRGDERLRALIRQAQVVTFHVPRAEWEVNSQQAYEESCGGSDNQDCLRSMYPEWIANARLIVQEIRALAPPPALVLAMDHYLFSPEGFDRWHPIGAPVRSWWIRANEEFAKMAAERGIPVARAAAAFNGPHGIRDAGAKGLLGPDGIHPSEKGARLIADLFRKLGYGAASTP